MGIIAKDDRQLTFIYSSKSNLGKQLLAYAESLPMEVITKDIDKENLGDTLWTELSELLQLELSEILSPEHPDAPAGFDSGAYDVTGWLKILNKNPALLQNAIAIRGNTAKMLTSQADIMSFFGQDSAGLEQSPTGTKKPDTAPDSEKGKFVP